MTHPTPKRPFAGIVAKLAADIVARLFQLGFIVIIARLLGTQGFGLYSLALFYGFLYSQLADFGLHLLTTREVSRGDSAFDKHDTAVVSNFTIEKFAVTALTAKIGLSGLLICFGAGVAFFYGANWAERIAFFVISSSFVVFSLAEFGFSLFRAWGKLGREAWLVLFNRLMLLLLGGVALWLGWGLVGLALAHLVSASAAAAIALFWAQPPGGWRLTSRAEAWPLYFKAWPLGMGLILSMLAFRIDIPLLYAFRSESEVGWYSAAYRLFEPGLLIPAALLAGFFPGIVRIAKIQPANTIRHALPLLAGLLGLGVIGGCGLALLAQPLVGLIYGPDYADAANILIILGLVVPIIFLNYGLTHLLIALDKENWNTLFFGVALTTNVIANLLFIPTLGGAGAAWSTLLTEVVLCLLCIFTLWKHAIYDLTLGEKGKEKREERIGLN